MRLRMAITANIVFLWASGLMSAEYVTTNGVNVSATLLKHTPGTVTLRLEKGQVKEVFTNTFEWESLARMLPTNNVYQYVVLYENEIAALKSLLKKWQEEADYSRVVKTASLRLLELQENDKADLFSVLDKYADKLPKEMKNDLLKVLSASELKTEKILKELEDINIQKETVQGDKQ